MLQYDILWRRLVTSLMPGGHSRAVCQQTPHVETDRGGGNLAATTVAVALRTRRAGAARRHSVALSRRPDGFGNCCQLAHEPTAGRALPGQGPGIGRARSLARSARTRPTPD